MTTKGWREGKRREPHIQSGARFTLVDTLQQLLGINMTYMVVTSTTPLFAHPPLALMRTDLGRLRWHKNDNTNRPSVHSLIGLLF